LLFSTLKGAGALANGAGERCGWVTRKADARITGTPITSGAVTMRSAPA